jgi:hypothetical protein
VMARRGDGLLKRPPPIIADELSDIAPRFAFVKAVERMARGDARFAAAALVEIDLKSELFAWRRRRERNEIAVMPAERRQIVTVVALQEFIDGSQASLLGEKVVDQRSAVVRPSLLPGVRR